MTLNRTLYNLSQKAIKKNNKINLFIMKYILPLYFFCLILCLFGTILFAIYFIIYNILIG